MKELIGALIKAQLEFLAIPRGETAQILTKSGSRFSYQYANLETCIEKTKNGLSNNGLCVIQTLGFKEGKPSLITTLWHTSGQSISGEQVIECSDPKDPQKVGSVITYYRRYGYMAILGLAPEDDDANKATEKNGKEEKREEAKKDLPNKAEKINGVYVSGTYNKDKARSEYLIDIAGEVYPVWIKDLLTEGFKEGQEVELTGFYSSDFKGRKYWFAKDIQDVIPFGEGIQS